MSSAPEMLWESELILDDLVRQKQITLGRGNIISKIDIRNNPGPYPIYSSSAKKNGKMGEYGNYMFDEELISWSVDGGGNFFYRPKHKFSVTNVSGYLRINNDKWDYRFLHYSLDFQHGYISFDYQSKAHPSVIRDLYSIPVIPKPEQQRIASILTSVDEVIERTEAQIRKLQDLKKGMMQELFTKGIGHTEFKDSPVGMIPRDWDVQRLSDCCSLMTNGYVGPTRDIYRSDGVPYILCQNVRPNVFVNHVYKHVDSDFHQKNKRSRLQGGDLVTVQTGAGNGDTCVVPKKYEDANCHALIISRTKKEILNPFFLCEFLNSFSGRRILNAISTGGAHPHTNTTELRKIRVPVPPIHEQTQIADSLNAAQKVIEDKTDSVEAAQKLKRGIMQDLLTGKVRIKVN